MAEILIPQKGEIPRRLTPRECARLMGFPESYKIVCSDTRAYKQFGNSVVVPMVETIANSIVQTLQNPKTKPFKPYTPRLCEERASYKSGNNNFLGTNNYQDFPWRTTVVAWHGLVAEILLQRTRAKNVIPVYVNFCEKFKTPSDLANSSIGEIEKCIYPLGLIWRAPLLQNLGKELLKDDGLIPEDYQTIIKLPGVGNYVASAWVKFSRQGPWG